MKCRKHSTDLSSCVGVCASCLRERLVEVIAAQVRAQREVQLRLAQAQQDGRKSDAQQESLIHPPLVCRGSVSPRRSPRKSDFAAASGDGKRPGNRLRFHSTPLVGPTGLMTVGTEKDKRTGAGKISSVFMGYFRSKSERTGLDQGPVWDRAVPVESYPASRSWFSGIIPGRRKKQIRSFCVEEDGAEPQRKAAPIRGRGMSPSNLSDGEDDEHYRGGSSGYSSEPSPSWKMTPRSTPAVKRSKGRKTAAAAAANSRNVSGLAFCLSPLVHPGPTRNWSQKVAPPDATMPGGEGRVLPKPHLSTAASFGKNRSRKLADFGKQSCSLHLNY